MVSHKYRDDYRLESYCDEKGRQKKRAVYIGALYRFAEPEQAARTRRLCLPLCAVMAVLYVLCFMQNGSATRQPLVVMVYVLGILPLVYLAWVGISLLLAREPLTRESRDEVDGKISGGCIALFVLHGLTLAGGVAACVVAKAFVLPGDAVFLGGTLVSLGLAVVLFTRRDTLRTVETAGRPAVPDGTKNSKTNGKDESR